MKRSCEAASNCLMVMGCALLAMSLILVPQGRALADDGDPGQQPPCTSNAYCDAGQLCFISQPDCNPPPGDWCRKVSDPINCGGCRCVPVQNDCQCKL
jgi:hypothetical protein